MLSRTLASQSLRRSLLASSGTLNSARRLPEHVRLNSSGAGQPTPDEKSKLKGGRDTLLRVWEPPIVTYEEVKLKTEQPSPVGLLFLLFVVLDARDSYHASGLVFD